MVFMIQRSLTLLFVLVLAIASIQASEAQQLNSVKGMFCDDATSMERYAANPTPDTLADINKEKTVCGVITYIFDGQREVKQVVSMNRAATIMEIHVVAAVHPLFGPRRIKPMLQYGIKFGVKLTRA